MNIFRIIFHANGIISCSTDTINLIKEENQNTSPFDHSFRIFFALLPILLSWNYPKWFYSHFLFMLEIDIPSKWMHVTCLKNARFSNNNNKCDGQAYNSSDKDAWKILHYLGSLTYQMWFMQILFCSFHGKNTHTHTLSDDMCEWGFKANTHSTKNIMHMPKCCK